MSKKLRYAFSRLLNNFIVKDTIPPFEQKEKAGILIVLRRPLGDSVVETPLLHELRRTFPKHHITLITTNYNLFELCPYVDEVVSDGIGGLTPFVKVAWKCHKLMKRLTSRCNYELAIVPSLYMPNMIDSWLCYFSKAPRRVTFSEKLNPQWHSWLKGAHDKCFTDALEADELKHAVEQEKEILAAIGAEMLDDRYELWTDEADKAAVERMYDIPAGRNVIVNMSTNIRHKEWPVENYIELCKRLVEMEDLNFLLIGAGEYAQKYSDEFSKHFHNVYDFTNKTTVRQTIEVMRKAELYIGGDTGPMHIAAALNMRGVGIFGVSKNCDLAMADAARRLYPWHADIKVLQPEKALPGCESGCSKNYAHCIKQVTVDEVYDVVAEILREENNR